MAQVEVSQADYEDATLNYTGYCSTCESFTRDMTEPDAEAYTCPDCGEDTVMGAENALISGLISFADD
jgi:predicted RNA-binding Zn-ribbon protein involved in translation (DUF1610 family)